MKKALLVLVVLCNCAGPVPVAIKDTRIAGPVQHVSVETTEMLDEAFGVWGLSWEHADSIDGSLELTLTDLDPGPSGVRGLNARSGKCDKSIVVEHEALLLAHEIGHVFGLGPHATDDLDDLGHDKEPWRVMSHPVLGWNVRDDQVEIVQEDAKRFSRCI